MTRQAWLLLGAVLLVVLAVYLAHRTCPACQARWKALRQRAAKKIGGFRFAE